LLIILLYLCIYIFLFDIFLKYGLLQLNRKFKQIINIYIIEIKISVYISKYAHIIHTTSFASALLFKLKADKTKRNQSWTENTIYKSDI